MSIDLDKGGRIPQVVRTYLGPSMGWVNTDSPVNYQFTFDGGGSTPLTGARGPLIVPDYLTIFGWYILATASGSCVFDIQKVTLDQYLVGTLPGAGDSICGSNYPTLSSGTSASSTTLTGWTTQIAQNDVLSFVLSSVATIQQVTLVLRCIRDKGSI